MMSMYHSTTNNICILLHMQWNTVYPQQLSQKLGDKHLLDDPTCC